MINDTLQQLGIHEKNVGVSIGRWLDTASGDEIVSVDPSTGEPIATVRTASRADYEQVVESAQQAFQRWRMMPPPARGEIVRKLGLALRRRKSELGQLVTLETGKLRSEGEGEVQEMIDMCDLATGLSRQLFGQTIASERPQHRMFEQWHPLGLTGIITAFNFPVAVWAWNAAVATVCGNPTIWKPSQLTPLTAIAVQNIVHEILPDPELNGLFNLCIGSGSTVGSWMTEDRRLPLISATGSCNMGRSIAQTVAARLGRSLLELGGNNGIVVTERANLDLALHAVLFAAVGTAGQRCTTLRRLILHDSIAEQFIQRLVQAYGSIRIGDPWDSKVLMGPLINEQAVDQMMSAMERIRLEGGEILYGGRRIDRPGNFVEPTIVRANHQMPIVCEETFAPILYILTYDRLDEAIEVHNSVDQGLSSAVFTEHVAEMEKFLSPSGSDCGIANVNIGTSGAEIGGAFGGEKDTGGGREAGSDAWKSYMRRQTCTINGGTDLPLAQGVRFEIG